MPARKRSLTTNILVFLTALVVPFCVINLSVSLIIISDSKSRIEETVYSTLESYMEKLERIVDNTEYFAYTLTSSNNNDLLQYFTAASDDTQYRIAKQAVISATLSAQSLTETADYYFYYKESLDDYLLVPHNSKIYDGFLAENQYFIHAASDASSWTLTEIDGSFWLYRVWQNFNVTYGALVSVDDAFSDIGSRLSWPVSSLSFGSVSPSAEDSGFISASEELNLYVRLELGEPALYHYISFWRYLLVLLLCLVIGIIPLTYFYIRRYMIQPLKTLNQAHRELEEGNEDYRITAPASSVEFSEAYQSFNHMSAGLKQLRLENLKKETARQEMLMENLQLQIRPHFLLNLFGLIQSMAQTRNFQAVQTIILFLSDYFRYLFQYNQKTYLFDKEFSLIQKYLAVAEYQLPGSFAFQYTLDPEISLVRVPPLLLHNFIENIISHALVHGRVIHIRLEGIYDEGTVTFRIIDDGRGMSPEEVAHIRESGYAEYGRGKHVGLRNSFIRLRYYYDGKGSVSVDSQPDEGTIITVTFPYDLEGEMADYETFDGQ